MTPRLSQTALVRTILIAIGMLFLAKVVLAIVQLFLAHAHQAQVAIGQTIGSAMRNAPTLAHASGASSVLFIAGVQLALLLCAVFLLYRYRSQAEGMLPSHFQYLIRTFWIGLLYGIIMSALSVHCGKAAAIHGLYTLAFFMPIISNGLLIAFNLARLLRSYCAIHRHAAIQKPRTWLI